MKKQEKSERKNINKKKNIIMQRNTKGITLIALVVTIIILIILSGVSINLVLGENGIVNKAKKAKENTELAKVEEETRLNELAKQIEEETSGGTTNPPVEKSEIEKSRDAGTYMTASTTLEDSDGNLIKVPEGFKIAEDSGINVTEGIVIEDNDIIDGIGNNRGNQYVWIPVGTGIKKADGSSVDITLGRYTFANGTSNKAEDGTVLTKGTPILKQSAEDYADEVLINSYWKELVTSRTGVKSEGTDGLNTTALNLKGFIDSVKANGGYYIARYEASYGTDGKANSKVSNNFIDTTGTAPTTEGTLWNNITQIDSVTASRNIYEAVTSDLVNSYAWDTAIVYIQNFSKDTDYSRRNSKNTSLSNTGINEDEVCKINDMSSNTREWTTEYSTVTSNSNADPCTDRGGDFSDSNDNTSYRNNNYATTSHKVITFRTTLYM